MAQTETTAKTFRGKLPRLKSLSRRSRIILSIVLLAALLGFGAWKAATAENCEDYLPKGQGAMDLSQTQYMKPKVEKIMAVKNYKSSPNCLNVVTTYYIYTGDYEKSKTSLAQLEKVYNSKEGFNATLKEARAPSIEELRKDVDYLKIQADAIKARGYLPHGRH